MPLTRQLSLFGVEASDPTPADLAGLLAGPGELGRIGGTARVAVEVDAAWRVHVLVAELALRGLASTWEPVEEPVGRRSYLVRTAYTTRLVTLAVAWSGAGGAGPKRPPPGFHLAGWALRLWVAAAGAPGPVGFVLRSGAGDAACWPAVGAALRAVGLPSAFVAPGAEGAGPAYRITGRRQVARLAELVGEPPPAAPTSSWPTSSWPT